MDNLRGIGLVILAMAAFSLEDMFIKRLSGDLPVGQILMILGVGSATIFATLAWVSGHRLFEPQAWQPLLLYRAGFEASASLAFATALSLVDLSVVASVFQATPLVITMSAALFLGEQVGWRRWSAILVGFLGVLMIIRPGFAGFDPWALLVLVAVVCVAGRDLVTKRIDATIASTVVSFQGFAVLIPAGALLLLLSPGEAAPVSVALAAMLGGAILFGAIGYYGIVRAMRLGDAAVVTPFRYSRLIFSLLVGVVVFNKRPDAMTLMGATLVIATGLYTFVRERRLASAALP